MRRLIPLAALLMLATMFAPHSRAAEDENTYPVAVRWWGQSMISIENWWGFSVVIDPYSLEIGYDDPKIEANTVCVSHDHFDHSNTEIVLGEHDVFYGIRHQGRPPHKMSRLSPPGAIHREDNADAMTRDLSMGEISITPIESFHDNKQGDDLGKNAMFLVEADGVRILHCGDLGQHQLTDEQLEQIGEIDVLCVPVGGVYTIDGAQAVAIVEQIQPRIVVPIHFKTKPLIIALDTIDPFLKALPDKYTRVRPAGNTLAVSTAGGATRDNPQVVLLNYKPWEMPEEIAELLDAKEAASKLSQSTFEKLRTDQLNHKPSNGTHTPRWNAEHMLSAELFFFSKIYAEADPAIAPIPLFPQQMPPDYVAAHPDWHGIDEAMQMQRVQDFTRRFAYLLDGMPLDELPEGGVPFFGDLRGLFKQMESHYGEHTAHVHTKTEQEDWPE